MYERTYWVDHVLSENSKFNVIPTDLGDDVYTITPYGTIMQTGTYQDAAHFNKIEEIATAEEIAENFLLNLARQNKWYAEEHIPNIEVSLQKLHEVEIGTVTLTNTLKFPFNNSQKTVALSKKRDNGNYIVAVEVQTAAGNTGEIIVSDTLANGFKIAHTGSASSVTVKYKVMGGYNG